MNRSRDHARLTHNMAWPLFRKKQTSTKHRLASYRSLIPVYGMKSYLVRYSSKTLQNLLHVSWKNSVKLPTFSELRWQMRALHMRWQETPTPAPTPGRNDPPSFIISSINNRKQPNNKKSRLSAKRSRDRYFSHGLNHYYTILKTKSRRVVYHNETARILYAQNIINHEKKRKYEENVKDADK